MGVVKLRIIIKQKRIRNKMCLTELPEILISHVYEITTYFVDTHILYIQVKEKAFKINAKNKLTEH